MKKTTPKHIDRLKRDSTRKRSTYNIKASWDNSDTEWQLATASCQLSWKKRLTSELLILEENLNSLNEVVGLNTNNILGKVTNKDHDDGLKYQEKLSESKQDYETIINDYLLQVSSSTQNICILLGLRTEFDLPIPVVVLLRMAAKISLIRWKDYKKRPNGLLKDHVYSLTPYLINISLTMFRTLVTILGTNIIPFMPFVNQTVFRILEWTRTSNLEKYDESLFHSIRLQVFKVISFLVEQLSLNINLEPQLLKSALKIELVDSLQTLMDQTSDNLLLRDRHIVEALSCLENLVIVYADLLDEPLEDSVKNFVIQTCVKIYRDFESNTVSTVCRRQLLHLLQIIANQPHATSTTEISYHIFELVEKVETDPDMRSLARRALRIGLAHRPTIVTHYDVYNSYSRTQLVIDQNEDEGHLELQMQVVDDSGNGRVEELGGEEKHDEQSQIESMQNGFDRTGSTEVISEEQLEDSSQQQLSNGRCVQERQVDEGRRTEDDPGKESQFEVVKERTDLPVQPTEKAAVVENIEVKDQIETIPEECDDSEILSYMNHFVDKLA